MSSVGRCVLAGLLAILAGGCGAATNHSNPSGNHQATAAAAYGPAAEASCTTGEANGKPLTASCVFVLADGRRFTCPERSAHAVQTASSLQRSTACRAIAPLHLSPSVRRVTATIEAAQACLTSHKVRASGAAVLPPLAAPGSPDGGLIVGYLPDGALIAFYRDSEKATRLAPAVIRNARRIHAHVERRGTTTIFWWRPPTPTLRVAVQDCLPTAS